MIIFTVTRWLPQTMDLLLKIDLRIGKKEGIGDIYRCISIPIHIRSKVYKKIFLL